MTQKEYPTPKFSKNDDVYILDTELFNTPTSVHGIVEEVGDETVLIKWDDLEYPTEYQLPDLPDIRHKPFEDGHDERFNEIQNLKSLLDSSNARAAGLEKMLWKYVRAQSRMLKRWSESDDLVKKSLWQKLHRIEDSARELLNNPA